jgi:hypothetical protein
MDRNLRKISEKSQKNLRKISEKSQKGTFPGRDRVPEEA